ncbi:WD40 repeat-like protein [Rhizoctonia solani]|uniref:WD40 repeat-like protein n=1 Tax=Rhizoctonia solani TaxID=456999 RepID=A0A8H7M374_9AGAM|nr:WD40 repeat-like protein [Rhizoctonia solani]
MSPLISSIAWVRRGVAVENPEKYNLDEKELERVQKLARIELEDAQIELQRASEAAHDMENRSDDEDSSVEEDDNDDSWEDSASDDDRMDEDVIDPEPKKSKSNRMLKTIQTVLPKHMANNFGSLWCIQRNIKGLTYYRSNDEDPYITLKESDDEEAERAELQSRISTYTSTTTMTKTSMSTTTFSSLPFLSASNGSTSSTSSSSPDPFNAATRKLYRSRHVRARNRNLVAGRNRGHLPFAHPRPPRQVRSARSRTARTGKKKRKQTKARDPTPEYHVDAVLGLAWNRAHRNILASASADATVKIWDLSSGAGSAGSAGSAVRSFGVHRDKVQSVQWNTAQAEVLLTGSYDHTVRVFDSRDPGKAVGAVVGADVEALRWDPWGSNVILHGNVHYFDARTLSAIPASGSLPAPTKSRFTLSAHTGAASALDINPHVRGCVATGGADKLVKIWNVEVDGDNVNASMVTSRNLEVVRKVFTVGFSPDDPLTLAAAGSKAKLQVWDIGANPGARKSFGSRLPLRQGGWERTREGGGVVGVQSDDEESGEE